MILNTVNTNRLGMSVIPGITRITPTSAGGGIAGLGDVTIGGTTLTTAQLLMIAVAAYLLLRR
jgi:hypothetical protein